MATVQEINQEWGGRLIEVMNSREAAIMFGFGLDKNWVLTMYATKDLTRDQLIEQLERIVRDLKNPTIEIDTIR